MKSAGPQVRSARLRAAHGNKRGVCHEEGRAAGPDGATAPRA